MDTDRTQSDWIEYRHNELAALEPVLKELDVTLDPEQPHVGGERHLIRPLSSGRKLILLGTVGGRRAVIKATRDPKAIAELEHERMCRDVLKEISFAYHAFLSPEELLFVHKGGFVITATAFIEQERPFTERPAEEQFALALGAFKAQEGAHAATYEHARAIAHTFGEMRAEDYLRQFDIYTHEVGTLVHDANLDRLLSRARAVLTQHVQTLEQYCGFLTHWDFTPQNVRVQGGQLYLLDHSAIRFGNKYEGWARFINFMELYNPTLARTLVQYVADNRTAEESESLRLMRIYRLGELVRFYAGWLPRTKGDLHTLAKARIDFWGTVLACVLDNKEVPVEVVDTYKKMRDSLRSEEEKRRQVGLH